MLCCLYISLQTNELALCIERGVEWRDTHGLANMFVFICLPAHAFVCVLSFLRRRSRNGDACLLCRRSWRWRRRRWRGWRPRSFRRSSSSSTWFALGRPALDRVWVLQALWVHRGGNAHGRPTPQKEGLTVHLDFGECSCLDCSCLD